MVSLILVLLSFISLLYQFAETKTLVNNPELLTGTEGKGEHSAEHHRLKRQADALIDAVKGLNLTCNDIVALVKRCIIYAEGARRPTGMTVDEYASIRLYTYSNSDCPFYRNLNDHLRQMEGRAGVFQAYVDILLSALSKLPVFEGMVWRGIRKTVYFCPIDTTLTWYAFTSTSTNRTISEEFGKLYEITNGQGYYIANISFFSEEEEVLLLPRTNFTVLEETNESCVLKQLTSTTSGCTIHALGYLALRLTFLLQIIIVINSGF